VSNLIAEIHEAEGAFHAALTRLVSAVRKTNTFTQLERDEYDARISAEVNARWVSVLKSDCTEGPAPVVERDAHVRKLALREAIAALDPEGDFAAIDILKRLAKRRK
jgi:hypothetical protein